MINQENNKLKENQMKKLILLIIVLYSNSALAKILIKGNIVSEVYPIYSEKWSKANPYCFDKSQGKCFPIQKTQIS